MKNMLSFLFLCFSFLVCSNFNLWAKSSISVVHNYECDEENSENHDVEFSLKNQSFSANVFLQAFPNPKIQNWGIKQKEKDFSFLVGNISFSGIKSRLNNPLWQSVNPLRVFSTPKLFNSAQLPSSISRFRFSITGFSFPYTFSIFCNTIFCSISLSFLTHFPLHKIKISILCKI